MKQTSKILLISLVLLVSVGCDQASKAIARQQLAGAPTRTYLGDIFRLQYIENTGAFLGLGASLPPALRFWIMVVLVSTAVTGMLIYILKTRDLSFLGILGWSLVIGGGLGNLIDRILNDGAVVDFMNLGLGRLRTGIFNIADVAVMLGLGIALLDLFVEGQKQEGASARVERNGP